MREGGKEKKEKEGMCVGVDEDYSELCHL